MAGYSSRIAVSHFANLQNEVVSRTIPARNLTILSISNVRNKKKQRLRIKSSLNSEAESQPGVVVTTKVPNDNDSLSVGKDIRVLDTSNHTPKIDNGSGGGGNDDGGNGKFLGGGGGGGGGNEGGDPEEEEFGPIMKFEEVLRETEARGATLPLDMLEAAKSVGIRKVLLLRYLDLQV